MRYAIIASTQDIAAMNIKDHLMLSGKFHELDETYEGHPIFEHASGAARLYTVDRSSVDCEGIDSEVDAHFIIFATRHRAESGIPSLTLHVCGNFSEARLGGKEKQISVAMPSHMKAALNFMFEEAARHAGVSFEIVQEATHHGPLLSKPSMFIEIGSDEKCWEDNTAGEIIAKTILYLVTAEIKHCEAVFVLGGGHYNQVAQKIMHSTKYAVGHICPKYALPHLDTAMLAQLMERSGSVPVAILDWKGLGQEKERIIGLLEGKGVKYIRSDRLEV